MKIRPVEAKLLHADRQKKMKLIVTFRKFANSREKEKAISEHKAQCWKLSNYRPIQTLWDYRLLWRWLRILSRHLSPCRPV